MSNAELTHGSANGARVCVDGVVRAMLIAWFTRIRGRSDGVAWEDGQLRPYRFTRVVAGSVVMDEGSSGR